MLGADENKPAGKGNKRKSGQQGKKTERSRKASQPKVTPDQLQAQDVAQEAVAEAPAPVAEAPITDQPVTQEPVGEQIAQDPIVAEVSAPVTWAESSTELSSPSETPATTEVAATSTAPVSLQAITNAYGDYSWKSLDQTRTFFEQLAGVRSLDKAFQLQSDFAQAAYDTFIAESRRIRELHGALAKQRLGHLEEIVARMTRLPR